MDKELLQIIVAIILAILGVGAFIQIKKSKKKNYKVDQKDIKIKGDRNKVVGGDDKSKS